MRVRAFTTVLALTAAAFVIMAQGAKIHLIHLDPAAVPGGCPAQVHFTGHIEATGPLTVQYQWLRSDGSQTEHNISFQQAGAKQVSTSWNVSKQYAGWMQLVILSPNHMQTAKAPFRVNCGK